jgi:hypothetical protein
MASRYKKGQPKPFLLRPEAREISLLDLTAMTEAQAVGWLAAIRWPEHWPQQQVCPHCQTATDHTWLDKYERWSCRNRQCAKQFNVLTLTKLQGLRRTAREIVAILFQFAQAAEGISSLHLSRLYNMTHQAMNVLTHKLREGLYAAQDPTLLTGEVEADAAYFFRYKRPGNVGRGASAAMRGKAKGAGLTESDKEKDDPAKMHALVTFVERGSSGEGGVRVKVAVLKTENQLDLLQTAKSFVATEAVVITDEHSGYNLLDGRHDHRTVNHSREFVSKDGAHTNIVEGFFSQMRRMQAGAYHRMGLGYLELYAVEMAWRYERRRQSNLQRTMDLARCCLTMGLPVRFADYWDKRPLGARIPKPKESTVAFEIPKSEVPRRRGRPPKSAGIETPTDAAAATSTASSATPAANAPAA